MPLNLGDCKVETDRIITKKMQSTYKAMTGPNGAVSRSLQIKICVLP